MTDNKESQVIELEKKNAWLTIWFNRPEARNSLSEELISELVATLEAVKEDRSVRGVILRGRGGIFCAGGDLKGFKKIAAAGDQAKQVAFEMSQGGARLFRLIKELPQITVTVVEGAAMAGGFGISCATDLLVAMSDASFALSETRIGLTPAQIAPYVIERMGYAQARKFMLLANQINGQQAFDLGMADYVVNDQGALEELLENIQAQVLCLAPNAVAATKKVVDATQTMEHQDFVSVAADLFSSCLISGEGQEGFSSFIEKRKPNWVIKVK